MSTKKRKIRFTIELTEKDQFEFMQACKRMGVDATNWKVIKDDKALYESDPIYKNICKRLSQAARDKADYQWKYLKDS